MKHYRYSTTVFWFSIIFPVILMIGMFIWAINSLINNGSEGIYLLVLIVMPLLFVSSVIGLNNPSQITVSSEAIAFIGFWRKHEYKWQEVTEFTVKDYGYVGKSFIRIGNFRLLGGRYWISNKLEGYQELLTIIKAQAEGREKHEGETLQSK